MMTDINKKEILLSLIGLFVLAIVLLAGANRIAALKDRNTAGQCSQTLSYSQDSCQNENLDALFVGCNGFF